MSSNWAMLFIGNEAMNSLSTSQKLIKYLFKILFSFRYKTHFLGTQHIPAYGGVLLLGNHLSYLDWAFLQLSLTRPIRFVIDKGYYSKKIAKPLFKLFNPIPISSQAPKQAITLIGKALDNGEIVALFPEGQLTRNGLLGKFRSGFEYPIKNIQATIIPFYIYGMWGSYFSCSAKKFNHTSFGRRQVLISFGRKLPQAITASEVKQEVQRLSVFTWKKHLQFKDKGSNTSSDKLNHLQINDYQINYIFGQVGKNKKKSPNAFLKIPIYSNPFIPFNDQRVASINLPDIFLDKKGIEQISTKIDTVGMALWGSAFKITDQLNMELKLGDIGRVWIAGVQFGDEPVPSYLDDKGLTWYQSPYRGCLDKDGFLTLR